MSRTGHNNIKKHAKTCPYSKARARLQSLIVLRTIKLAGCTVFKRDVTHHLKLWTLNKTDNDQ